MLSLAAAVLCGVVPAVVFDFEATGGAPDDATLSTAWHNGRLLNATLGLLQPGDELVVPNKTFHVMGGIVAHNLTSAVLRFEGTIVYDDTIRQWPRRGGSKSVLHCLHILGARNLTITSSTKGTFDGQGKAWWGVPGLGYLARGENRPNLLKIENGAGVLVENLLLRNSPDWTFWAPGSDGLEVRNVDISARRSSVDRHGAIEMTAFNTDGFDVTGRDVWIHDCTVWNQDDCIAVKDGSEDMLFERIEASGIGLTIGSIGASTVRNITFRDCHMHHTSKGIYMKFNGQGGGLIEDVLYENITIDEPEATAIWIGPAQQSDSDDLCAAHPCSICWPTLPTAKCLLPASSLYRNITLRDITVNNPKKPQSFVMANTSNPMRGVVFDSVVVTNPGTRAGKSFYQECVGVSGGVATGRTSPVPPCFADNTTTTAQRGYR